MKLLCKIMYDGSGYCGFQSQKNGNSVQEVLTKAASSLFARECTVTGCSRTDAGVHALGFCAAIEPVRAHPSDSQKSDTWMTIPLDKLPRAAEHFLPSDIAICDAAFVPDDFHPRYNVAAKEYIYKISDIPYRDPFSVGRVWQVKKPISDDALERMQQAAGHIRGYRNYASFMAAGSKITDPRRTVYNCTVTRDPSGMIVLRISADGFLYNMVRIITGTLLDVAQGIYSPDDIPQIIDACDRSAAGRTAPASGLYLNEVWYNVPVTWGMQNAECGMRN